MLLLNTWAQRDHGQTWSDLSPEQQAVLKARLKSQIRTNTYDPESRQIVVSSDRAAAFRILGDYYGALFGNA